jgi:hypothetical protein
VTPRGNGPATLRLVTQYPNQLHHRVPQKVNGWTQKFRSGCIKLQGVHIKVTEWTQKFRSGHKISGWTESYAVHRVSGGHKITAWTYSFGVNKKFRSWQGFEVDTKFRSGHIVTVAVYLTKRNLQTTKLSGVSWYLLRNCQLLANPDPILCTLKSQASLFRGIKVTFTLKQTMKAPTGSRGIDLLFL